MSSRDLFWYEDVVKEDFLLAHKTKTINQNMSISNDTLKDFNSLVLTEAVKLKLLDRIKLQEIWLLENTTIDGDLILLEDFKARNNINYAGSITALNVYFGHNTSLNGNFEAKDKFEVGNSAIITGDIKCAELRIGENAHVSGTITADEIYAGSNFYSDGNIKCTKFMTGENSKLMGKNIIDYLYSQNGLNINGGQFLELHTDDNFKSKNSMTGNKLIMDNCVIINGNVKAKDYIRVGDKSVINGDVYCENYLEFGPGTTFNGKKYSAKEKQLPPSSAKIRNQGPVHFAEF